jgi:phosphoglycolate phosphatase
VRASLGAFGSLVSHYDCGAALSGKAAKYRRLLRRTGIPAQAAISIGDEVRDAEAAAQAGIAFGAVTWGYATRTASERTNPRCVFRTMDEIVQLLAVGFPGPEGGPARRR